MGGQCVLVLHALWVCGWWRLIPSISGMGCSVWWSPARMRGGQIPPELTSCKLLAGAKDSSLRIHVNAEAGLKLCVRFPAQLGRPALRKVFGAWVVVGFLDRCPLPLLMCRLLALPCWVGAVFRVRANCEIVEEVLYGSLERCGIDDHRPGALSALMRAVPNLSGGSGSSCCTGAPCLQARWERLTA